MKLRIVLTLALAVGWPALTGVPAEAQVSTSVLGSVTSAGAPVAGASITLSGNNLTLHALSDSSGRFGFSALPLGEYVVEARRGNLQASQVVEAASGGAVVLLALIPLSVIGRVAASAGSVPARTSGADTLLSRAVLTRSAFARNFPNILLTLPQAARASNGQVHINGDHADINYIVDGVPVPQELSRVLGSEFDPTNVAYVETIMGAFPAQYGDKFAAVLNIGTRAGLGAAGATFEGAGGSLNTFDSEFVWHAPVGNGGGILFSNRLERDGRALDPPVLNVVHDSGSVATQFLRFSYPLHAGRDNLNLDLNHSYQTFQIPPDTANGQSVTQDDNETQDDTFVSLLYRHQIGASGSWAIGSTFKRSHIRDFNDLQNDLTPADPACATDPGSCIFSAATDRTAKSYGLLADYSTNGSRHSVRAGASYRADIITKLYDITIQANNFIQPAPLTIVDTTPNIGHEQSAYVQDTWTLGKQWALEYGLRQDSIQLSSTDFRVGFAQLSPRIKLTREFSPRSSIYAYYGRLFIPFGFENIGVASAAFLNPASSTSFDLKPQRDSLYELGGHLPIGGFDLGIRLAHYVITDVLDDGQVGTTNIHQDINFAEGRIDEQSLLLQRRYDDGARLFLTVTHSLAINRGCGSSLLIDCSQFPDGFVPADHDQRVSAALGVYRPTKAGWYSANVEYGSGLSSGECDICKVPPHLTLDGSYGWQMRPDLALALTVRNAFNDSYAVTLNNSLQGTHYARPRSFELRLMVGKP